MKECRGVWTEEYWCLLGAPQTSVDLTVTLISALLAAWVAIIILRRQFNHDRSLAVEQRKADIELLRVEAALPYIQQLGNALIDMGRSDYRTDAGKSGQAVWGSSEGRAQKTSTRCGPGSRTT